MLAQDVNLLLVALGAAIVLEHLLGVDLLIHAAKKTDVALRLAAATAISTLLVLPLGLLAEGLAGTLGVAWLRLPLMALAVTLGVAIAGAILNRLSPRLGASLNEHFALLTGNGLLLGVLLLSPVAPAAPGTPAAMLALLLRGGALAAGFCILLVVFGYIQQRLTTSNIPRAFRGAPISLISLGILALAFQGFRG